jgi:hypothetical protein
MGAGEGYKEEVGNRQKFSLPVTMLVSQILRLLGGHLGIVCYISQPVGLVASHCQRGMAQETPALENGAGFERKQKRVVVGDNAIYYQLRSGSPINMVLLHKSGGIEVHPLVVVPWKSHRRAAQTTVAPKDEE